jgi:cytidylate kinase
MTKRHYPYNQEGIIVAIDGPAGAGKSTIAKALALDLNYLYIDTGAMYRAVAYACIKNNVDCKNEDSLKAILPTLEIDFVEKDSERLVYLNGVDVSDEIRNPSLYGVLSIISAQPVVRQFLLEKQRAFATQFSVVMEGRDIGTVVFPKAAYKFFLTASAEVRAKRRFLEFKHKGMHRDEQLILQEIVERDNKDRNREIAPLKKASDAFEIDSSSLNAEAVVHQMLFQIFKKEEVTSTT